jgi:endonuclease-3 related protein
MEKKPSACLRDLSLTYRALLHAYGPQGWWPLLELHDAGGVNPTKSGSIAGYHPGDYSYPHTDAQRFEICVGAILTQNTSWPNVEKALLALRAARALSPERILRLTDARLGNIIKPAGYFNQKTKKLKIFSDFYLSLNKRKTRAPSREELLSLWGIGPETADSMLLYAWGVPTFVVDAYTRRIGGTLGWFTADATYDEIKAVCEAALPRDVVVYRECHALFVEHAKRLKSGEGALSVV